MKRIQLAEERDQWWTLTNMVVNLVYVTGGELHDLLNNYQTLIAALIMRSSTKVMPIFFLRNYNYIYN